MSAPMTGLGLLSVSAIGVLLLSASAPVVPEHALLVVWITGAAIAGRVTRTIDASLVTRAMVLVTPVAMLASLRELGFPVGSEVVATLVVGLIPLAVASSPEPATSSRPQRSRRRTRRFAPAAALVGALLLTSTVPSGAWFAAVRGTPTQTQTNTGGIDLQASTHQWLASQGVGILGADGNDVVAAFLSSPDPTAPEATDPATGTPLGSANTYEWRLLKGAGDADGVLYPQIRDHLHNHWSHRGRQYIVGASAASNAQKAFDEAVRLWKADDRGNAVYWLGAALHLVQDSCVPQHGWFGVGVYHHDYEKWVRDNQDGLAVADAGIYRSDFRVGGGHGGDDWSSSRARGWADECAHRAFENLPAASHPYPSNPNPNDLQWATANHVADVQRMSAGFIVFFFDTVAAP
ncbi:MAG: hypothetical protein OSA99_09340 [Acidimicrobiales bacterium]|nr:hypothetical protein [Acidimicrobiales bacterium]